MANLLTEDCAHNPSRYSIELVEVDEDGDLRVVLADSQEADDRTIWLDKYARRNMVQALIDVDDYRLKEQNT